MMRSGIAGVEAVIVLVALGAVAQVEEHFNFSVGAGFSVPTDAAGKNLNTGWNFDLRGGCNIAPHLSANLDFAYNYWNLNLAALARFGEPGGYNSIWSLSFNPVYQFVPKSKTDFYTTGGFGLYHQNLTLTRPATENVLVCDPFFGFCFPAVVGVTEVVASSSRYKGGFNLGGGVEFRLGDRRTKVFSEARYQRMFTTHATDLTYVPMTLVFGVSSESRFEAGVNLRAVLPHTFRERDGPTIVTSEQPRQQRQPVLHSVARFKRRSLIAAVVAASTLGSGIVNLISVVGGISQPKMLVAIFPLEFSRLSRTLTLLIGFALIVSAVNIYKRKKRAWAIVLALSLFSTIFHLTRELNFEKVLLSSTLLLLLLFARSTFTVRSRSPDLRSAVLCFLISASAAISYGITQCLAVTAVAMPLRC